MKKLLFSLMMFNITFGILSQDSYKLMTYNIKLDYPKEGKDSWDHRKDWMIAQINFYSPDIFGVQEAMANQMHYMDSKLTKYAYIGVGRDDGKEDGEFSAIFYDKTRLKIIKGATFWLSETPNKVSRGWDAACNRICTYALFEDLQNKRKFWVFNTHFDHVGTIARTNSTTLILEKIKEISQDELPVFLMGDFNLEPESEHIQTIKTTLLDSKEVSITAPFGPSGTFNNFEFDKPVTTRIDYIFINKNTVKVNTYAVLSDNKELRYPSDHLPVFIEVELTN